ncbi:hypothetical protein HRI_002458700 [Hibiscus trionum]|uniref:Uncharacterized protein n=1 Tax=Hibiscus trionum TaxID=183268 RepID=A0A9W7I225_HIBTR|nr:hypothetical protein HRI_002458700 [Hibiscus trionum]
MNGYSYSKIKVEVAGNESSISMESSPPDLVPIPDPETPKPTSNPTPNPIKNSNPDTQCPSEQEDDARTEGKANGGGEKMSADPTLKRNSSVSSAYALQLQAAVKRAFSMRRSCSVSESYCRIHDQYVTLTSPLDEDEASDISGTKGSAKKKNNTRDKILKAWKKIFKL